MSQLQQSKAFKWIGVVVLAASVLVDGAVMRVPSGRAVAMEPVSQPAITANRPISPIPILKLNAWPYRPGPRYSAAAVFEQAATLPIEVLGAAGSVMSVTLNAPNGASATKLWLQVHALTYQDKASVQVNNAPWITLNNTSTVVADPGRRYGGIGGPQLTLKLTVDLPAGAAVNGQNVVRFRFNFTDGESMGYRVLNLNLLDGTGNRLLPSPPLPLEDPATWTPPISNSIAISEGEQLWRAQNIMILSPLDSGAVVASCADCHSQSGYDLKYFNFSNKSIIERAKFHGLTQPQGEKIASFIRALQIENPGRAWNPPYQPGPGTDAKPASDWAAGAGIDAVLDRDLDMQPYMPGGMTSADAVREGNRIKRFNVREVPLAVQLPDWNHWLPKVHPVDALGPNFYTDPMFTGYKRIRDGLTGVLPGYTAEQYKWSELRKDLNTWQATLSSATGSPGFLSLGVPVGQEGSWTRDKVKKQYAAAIWGASKLFEIMHEFELEELGREFYGQNAENKQWFSNRHIFNLSPKLLRMVDAFPVAGDGNARTTNLYIANTWYVLQVILNPGARNAVTGGWDTNDWDYMSITLGELRWMATTGPESEPMRSAWLALKAYDHADSGYGPDGRNRGGVDNPWWGWNLRDNVALLLHTPRDRGFADFGSQHPDPDPVLRTFYQVWLEKSAIYSADQWVKALVEDDNAINMSSRKPDYVIPNWDNPTPDLEWRASAFAYNARYVRNKTGLEDAVANSMAEFGALLWPNNPWDNLKVVMPGPGPAAPLAVPGVDKVSLTWTPLAGATSYNVKRSDSANGRYLPVRMFATGSGFTDTDMNPGRVYYYKISANKGLSETQDSPAIAASANRGLVGYWAFDEAGGDAALDSSGGANHGLLINGPARAAGHTGGGLNLSGSNREFVALDRNARWLNGDFTLMAWISTTATGSDVLRDAPALMGATGKDLPDAGRVALVGALDASGRIGLTFNEADAGIRSSQPVNTGQWRHVALTRDSGTGAVRIYVDGALSASGTVTTGWQYQRAYSLGRADQARPENYWRGGLDELRLYDRPLSGAEVQAIYAGVAASPALITSARPTSGTVNAPYSFSFVATGQPTPVLTLTGALPAGLSFDGARLSGTPGVLGSFPVTVTAFNGVGDPDVRAYVFEVVSGPVVTTLALPGATYGSAYRAQLAASGLPAPAISLSGQLPAGLVFANGEIAGTPLQSGLYPVTVTATNGAGSAVRALELRVDRAELTVTANSITKTASGAWPALTASYAGFVNGDTAGGALTGAPALTTVLTSSLGSYPIDVTRGSLGALNYQFRFVPGRLYIVADGGVIPPGMYQRVFLPGVAR